MLPKVQKAVYRKEYIIEVHFSDGTSGDIDFADELHGELFEPLKDVDKFKQFKIHPDFHTLYWPNGADVAPEFLYKKVQLTV
jgi:hypothetical protein